MLSLTPKFPSLRPLTALALAMTLTACSSWQPRLPVAEPGLAEGQLERHRFALAPGSDVVGDNVVVVTRPGDTLPDLARHFGLGHQQIADANPGLDLWLPEPGSRAVLPLQFVLPDAPRRGLVINLANRRLYYFPDDKPDWEVQTYPVGVGREGWSTPTGSMTIASKTANPTWYVPLSIQKEHAAKGDPLPAAVPPGPDNPLGAFAMYLSRPGYLIHGTNKPYGIGLRVSHGCLQLYPEDIAQLFPQTAVKTPVRVVNQPYLLGRLDGQWYLEAHQPADAAEEKRARALLMKKLKELVTKDPDAVDWQKVETILVRANGVPLPIGMASPAPEMVMASLPTVTSPEQLHGAPPPVAYEPGQWYVRVLETPNDITARRLAVMLNHQGPAIPALVKSEGTIHLVLAGPFPDATKAKRTRNRIQREFDMDKLQLVAPQQATALNGP